MVDANRHPEDGPNPPRWLARLLAVGLSLVAVFRGITGRPARGTVSPPDERDGPPPGGLQHPSVRFEHSDASFRWILGLVLGAMVSAAVVQYAVLVFYHRYGDYEAGLKRSQYPMAPAGSQGLPPEPRLEQLNRLAGVEKGNVYLRQEEKEAILNSYGAAEKGYVHIPIGQAMDQLADQLPARKERPSAEQARRQNGLVDAGESNSGRMFRGGSHD